MSAQLREVRFAPRALPQSTATQLSKLLFSAQLRDAAASIKQQAAQAWQSASVHPNLFFVINAPDSSAPVVMRIWPRSCEEYCNLSSHTFAQMVSPGMPVDFFSSPSSVAVTPQSCPSFFATLAKQLEREGFAAEWLRWFNFGWTMSFRSSDGRESSISSFLDIAWLDFADSQ